MSRFVTTSRRQLARAGFGDGALLHEIAIPSGPDGRPGERLMAPSRSVHPPRIGRDGTRHDFTVLADRHGSTLKALCLRPAVDEREAERSAWTLLVKLLEGNIEGPYEVWQDRIVGEPAFRYEVSLRRGRLTEWKLTHAGWLYVIGLLCRVPSQEPDDTTTTRARNILDRWSWIDWEVDDTADGTAGARTP